MQPGAILAIVAGVGTVGAVGTLVIFAALQEEDSKPKTVPPPSKPPRPADDTPPPPYQEPDDEILSTRTVDISENASMPGPITIEVVRTPGGSKPFETRFRHFNGINRYFHTNRAAADMRASDLMVLRPMAISCVQEFSEMFGMWRCERDQKLVTGDIAGFGMVDDGTSYHMVRVRVDTDRDKPFIGEHQAADREAWQPMGSWEYQMQALSGVKV